MTTWCSDSFHSSVDIYLFFLRFWEQLSRGDRRVCHLCVLFWTFFSAREGYDGRSCPRRKKITRLFLTSLVPEECSHWAVRLALLVMVFWALGFLMFSPTRCLPAQLFFARGSWMYPCPYPVNLGHVHVWRMVVMASCRWFLCLSSILSHA
ncbi:hypothetical protein B0T11DRAFT_291190 [Plectosphaerella cucumerina]|uniref:Uncharacterized protein n=1 Tax=Plectosphaerella cucumerina TaxID=40658 RepID=A0A8K0T528_9PEZI|nr:hypothetical protein B0T11DRAFT_291190 [Plectosphaerella cucumerina]